MCAVERTLDSTDVGGGVLKGLLYKNFNSKLMTVSSGTHPPVEFTHLEFFKVWILFLLKERKQISRGPRKSYSLFGHKVLMLLTLLKH
jgi:hypothetical protein